MNTVRAKVTSEIADIDRRLFGGFVEHLGRHVYDGIYEPGHPTAEADGFRADVIELVRELGVSAIRYPGGNFVSGYRWEDGVGPKDQRPRRLDLAWHSIETNEVGLHEFQNWLERVGSELVLATNLGTRGVQETIDLLEYTNLPVETELTGRRAANGRVEPFNVRMWCLGNEMDGWWQVGGRTARDYGQLAARTARAMRRIDPTLELVACGSSSRDMPTFGEWERSVLTEAFDEIDFLSCHAYYEELGGDAQEFLASAVDMDLFITEVVAICDQVADERGSDKRIKISFDEWNVWYQTRWNAVEGTHAIDDWPVAPRLLEDVYNVLDAVVVGDLLITLIRHADRVRSASLAQLVNVIAPIMTQPSGPAWRQTTFHPFALTSRLAQGRAFELTIESGTFQSARFGDVSNVNGVATSDAEGTSVFLVNRSMTTPADLTIDLGELGGAGRIVEAHVLRDSDFYATNTATDPDRVRPRQIDAQVASGVLRIELPPVSWVAVRIAL